MGHLRDARRLVVAMSRARLGLYVFARVSLFKNCFELTPAFNQLMLRPMKLMLLPHETYPSTRFNTGPSSISSLEIEDMPHMAKFVYNYYMEKVSAMKVIFFVSLLLNQFSNYFLKKYLRIDFKQ